MVRSEIIAKERSGVYVKFGKNCLGYYKPQYLLRKVSPLWNH